MYHHQAIKIERCIVKPGVGFGPLHFGMTKNEVIEVLGQKPHKEEINTDVVWEYFEFMYPFVDWTDPVLRLTFDSLEDFKLTSIYVSGSQYAIENSRIELFNMKLAEQTPKSLLLENIKIESKDNFTFISSDELGLTIRFENNMFNSISLFPCFLNDDEYQWPN